MSNTNKLFEDFQRSFKFSRFEERKTFGIARNEAIDGERVHFGSLYKSNHPLAGSPAAREGSE